MNASSETNQFLMYSLTDLMSAFDESELMEFLNTFKPVFDSSTGAFLKKNALSMKKRDLSRTFIALSHDRQILGYVSLGIKCITISDCENLSKNTIKHLNVENGTQVAQSYLLGRLARSSDAPQGIGSKLMEFAFERVKISEQNVRCHLIRLDCISDLIPYYESHGFRRINKNSTGTLNQMFAFV